MDTVIESRASEVESPEIKVKVGDLVVLASGTVHAFDSARLVITVAALKYTFNFFTNAVDKPKVDWIAAPNDTLNMAINVYNFDNALGTGVVQPIKIGIIENDYIYLSFYVWAPTGSANGLKIINYVIYRGGKE
jgi:hypothetical protein